MQIQSIDKAIYRSRLNKVLFAFIVSFLVLALVFGQSLILLLSEPGQDNFWLNLSGVILALIVSLSVITQCKNKAFMHEVYYVWQLKQQINFIYRKLKKVKQFAFDDKDINALIILKFYYKACYQLYTLDDNTITLSSLNKEQQLLSNFLDDHNLNICESNYSEQLIKNLS